MVSPYSRSILLIIFSRLYSSVKNTKMILHFAFAFGSFAYPGIMTLPDLRGGNSKIFCKEKPKNISKIVNWYSFFFLFIFLQLK